MFRDFDRLLSTFTSKTGDGAGLTTETYSRRAATMTPPE
jgi:hypothetical protein